MSSTRLLVVVLALAGAAVGARAKAPAPTPAVPEAAIKAVKEAAPKGWTVSVKGDALIVRRDEPVSSFFAINAPPGPHKGSPHTYEVVLTFCARVSPEEYAKLRQENAALGKKLDAMGDGLRAARITHKFDEWLPETDEQKKLVAAYRAERAKLHHLPDLYSDTHSIDVRNSHGFGLAFTKEAEREECTEVQKALLKLFKSYSDEKPKR